MINIEELYHKSLELLQQLISTPSFSREEDKTAEIINNFFIRNGVKTQRKLNNVWARNLHFNPAKPTILLNSHHDTVKPNSGYTRDPFKPAIEDGKLYGLGSNDAGGCLVSLMATFLNFYKKENLKYNLIIACTAEEENSGVNGVESILDELGPINFAVVGEPTLLDLAISEKGLLVVDCVAYGKSGHAAREEGENAIYNAMQDMEWFKTFSFPKVSDYLGKVKMTVTVINAGTQHNVIPDKCHYTVDIRVTDVYSHEEIMDIIQSNVKSEVKARSLRLKSSRIDPEHPFVKAGVKLGRKTYGSPTTSDQAVISAPSLKFGPGDSARSHSADEFIYLHELKDGIELYIKVLNEII